MYLALFNISENKTPMSIAVDMAELGIKKAALVKNMWADKVVGTYSGKFEQTLNSHASGLYKITEKK